MIPGSPRSGHYAESCAGPQLVEGLPASSQPDNVIAVDSENLLVHSIVDRYLGPSCSEAPTTSGIRLESDNNMSVTGLISAKEKKKILWCS